MDKLKIGIVIVNYNGLEDTLECLESLRRVDRNKNAIELIVVENGSSDGSSPALAKLKDIHLVESTTNLGFAGGANLGIKHAIKRGASYVLVLNNDTIAHQHLLKNLMAATKAGQIISPKIYFAPGFEFHKTRYKKQEQGKILWYAGAKIDWQNIIGVHIGVDQVDKDQFNKRQEIDLATGACMLIKREVFEKIGYFDERYFLYLEDMDFSTRAKKAGFKIIFEPNAILWHKNAASSGGSGSNLQDYYITRNRLLFATKYANLRTKFALIRQIASQITIAEKRKALFDFLTLRFGKGDINAG